MSQTGMDNNEAQAGTTGTSGGLSGVKAGGAGQETTPANSATSGGVTGSADKSGPELAAAEPDFMKSKPGNPPGIMGNLREGLFGTGGQ